MTITGITGDGTLSISVAAGAAAGEGGAASPAAGPSSSVTVDNTAPGISIGAPSPETAGYEGATFTVSYTGADSVSLAAGNITLHRTGTANGTVSVTGSGTASRTVHLADLTGNGTLAISIAAGTARHAGTHRTGGGTQPGTDRGHTRARNLSQRSISAANGAWPGHLHGDIYGRQRGVAGTLRCQADHIRKRDGQHSGNRQRRHQPHDHRRGRQWKRRPRASASARNRPRQRGQPTGIGPTAVVLVDNMAPAPVTVSDEGRYTFSTSVLRGSWTPSSDGTGVGLAGYEYGIGTSPAIPNVRDWTSAGLNLSASVSGLSLDLGRPLSARSRG